MDSSDSENNSDNQELKEELESTISRVLQQAEQHIKAGEHKAAEVIYHAVYDIEPNNPIVNYGLGLIAMQDKQPERACPYFHKAITEDPNCAIYWVQYIDALILCGQLNQAREALKLGSQYGLQGVTTNALRERITTLSIAQISEKSSEFFSRASILQKPTENSADLDITECTILNEEKGSPSPEERKIFKKLLKGGNTRKILQFAQSLIEKYPNDELGWKTIGNILEKDNKNIEAYEKMKIALDCNPNDHMILNDLAKLCCKLERYSEAELHVNKVLANNPSSLAALEILGGLSRAQGRLLEAAEVLRRAIQIEEKNTLYNSLGLILMELGQIITAEDCFRKVIKIDPSLSSGYSNLGLCLHEQGRTEESIKHLRQAVKISPHDHTYRSILISILNYLPDRKSSSYENEINQFARLVQKNIKEPFTSWNVPVHPERMRIGIILGNLHQDSIGVLLEEVLAQTDRELFEFFAYNSHQKSDELTSRLQQRFSKWQDIYAMDDQKAAQTIHSDAIHILLDISGHNLFNRLPIFAWKPAPVQVSWFGYPATTGLDKIDYILVDKDEFVHDNKEIFAESIWDITNNGICVSPPIYDIPVSSLPAGENGYVTFGCFQPLSHINNIVLDSWGKILAALPPETQLVWQCNDFDDPGIVKNTMQILERAQIDKNKVSLHGGVSPEKKLLLHRDIDIILDSFPVPGKTSTCEALWMGVPTLTLAGQSVMAKQGAGILATVGLKDWIAYSLEEYIDKAIFFAKNVSELSHLRSNLRPHVLLSPIFNIEQFTRSLEGTFTQMWAKLHPVENKNAVNNSQGIATGANEDKPVKNFFFPLFWGTKDPAAFTELMRKAAALTTAYHFGDNMFLFQRNNSMFNDQPFVNSWENNITNDADKTIVWRRYILAMAGYHCQHLDGDFVECGAYQGTGAKTVLDYLGGKRFHKTFWLYDLFEHNEKMVNHAMSGHSPKLHAQVVERFSDYPNVRIFKGFLPDVLDQGCPNKIAYLHLDLNQAPAEIATLDYLFDRVVPGGMIILDDYEMVFYRPQKLAEDIWFGKRGYKVFPLPTSQGFVIKR